MTPDSQTDLTDLVLFRPTERSYEAYEIAARSAGKDPLEFLKDEGLRVLAAYLRVQKNGNTLYEQNPQNGQSRLFRP